MEDLRRFSLPIKGLKLGIHTFTFEIGEEFFKEFVSTTLEKGGFKVEVVLDKRISVCDLSIKFDGFVTAPCDRCLEEISLPLEGEEKMIIKYSSIEKEEEDVLYITQDTAELNVAKYIYEYISLALPLSFVYDCMEEDSPPCNQEVLSKLISPKKIGESNTKENGNSPWDILKNLPIKE
jgi:uncharacterized metal-binding protein YceD (DUF177 family)